MALTESNTTRRAFLQQAILASGGAWLASGLQPVLAAGEAAAAHDGERWNALDAAQAATLAAVADQLWPPGETAGAAEIGAVRFMDVALGGFMAGALPMIQAGTADLDVRARSVGAEDFASLPFEQQTGILEQVENTGFFGTTHFMTLCGLFALPSWGGNRDRAGWHELGFEARHAWAPPFGAYDAAYTAENGHGD
jgi:hypothetical protein